MVTHRRGIGPFEVCTDSKVWGREALTIRGLFAEYQSDWNGHDIRPWGIYSQKTLSGSTSLECTGAGSLTS